MSAEQWFSIANMVAIVGWLALVFLPQRASTLISAVLIPALIAVGYTLLIIFHFGDGEGGFGSLADVALLFRNPWALLAGWIHYLAFDLFIGSWEVRDARRLGIPHLAVIPSLVLTFLFGPIGLLLYFIIRGGWKRKFVIE